ncbi:MAG TPA: DUF3530 family protein [Methylophaga sp.]|nr:DUF3530 family protein [Methylophaga sp.]
MSRLYWPALFFVVLGHQAFAGAAADTESKSSTMPMVQSGGAVNGEFTLDVAGQPVAATYLPQTLGKLRGAIILLHDESTQYDGPLLHRLREELPAFGWDTLTVSLNDQMVAEATQPETIDLPVTDADAPEAQAAENNVVEPPADGTTDPENPPADSKPENSDIPPAQTTVPGNPARMDAAIAWLSAKNPQHLIILGHGAGVQTAINAIAATPRPISALVMISADEDITAEKIIDANVPVLDIMGSQIDAVLQRAAVLRYSKLKLNTMQPYSQRIIDGADRNFEGMETLLSKQVHSWLHRQLIADLRP